MDFADQVLADSRELSTFVYQGQHLVAQTSSLDRIDVGLTVLANHTHARDYEYKLGCLDRLEKRGAGIMSGNPGRLRDYTQAAVQASSGFQTEENARAALEVLNKVRKFASIDKSPETASALAMSLTNFARYAGKFDLGSAPIDFIKEAVELACRFPQSQHDISRLVLGSLETLARNSINAKNFEEAIDTINLSENIFNAAEECDYGPANLYCAWLFDSGFKAYIEGHDELFDISRTMIRRLSSSKVVLWQQMISNINPLGTYYSLGMQGINTGDIDKAKRSLDVLEQYAEFEQKEYYEQFIEPIKYGIANLNDSRPTNL